MNEPHVCMTCLALPCSASYLNIHTQTQPLVRMSVWLFLDTKTKTPPPLLLFLTFKYSSSCLLGWTEGTRASSRCFRSLHFQYATRQRSATHSTPHSISEGRRKTREAMGEIAWLGGGGFGRAVDVGSLNTCVAIQSFLPLLNSTLNAKRRRR